MKTVHFDHNLAIVMDVILKSRFYAFLLLTSIVMLSCSKEEENSFIANYIDDVEVVYNPTGYAPLSAIVRLKTSQLLGVVVESNESGEPFLSNDGYVSDSTYYAEVHGLTAGMQNRVTIIAYNFTGDYDSVVVTIDVDPLPEFFPEIHVDKSEEDALYFLEAGLCQDGTSIGYPMVMNSEGVLLWYLNLRHIGIVALPMTRLQNGNFITSKRDSLFEINLLGEIVNTYNLPGHSVHHDIQETSDGNFIILTSKDGVATVEDFMIEYNPETQAIVKEWDFGSILDVSREDISTNSQDWLHANSVDYIESKEVFVVSARHQGIFEMSYEGELNWIFAPHKNWTRAGRDRQGENLRRKLLTAIDSEGTPYHQEVQNGDQATDDFDWSWAQHGALSRNQSLYCFDNGWLRQFKETGITDGVGRGVHYIVDDENMTVQQYWDYSGSGNELYSFAMGDIDILNSDEILILSSFSATPYGAGTRILEIEQDNNTIKTDISIVYKNQNCIPGVIFGSNDFIYQGGRFSF